MDISSERLAAMRTAIELGVDASDFAFATLDERAAWHDLCAEHADFAERNDLVWSDLVWAA